VNQTLAAGIQRATRAEKALAALFYFAALAYLRPFKRAANARRAKETSG